MDRISAIRNVENALRAFENGEIDLAGTEQRVATVLRTYATEFEGAGSVYRAVGDDPVDGCIVVARSKPAARERVLRLVGIDPTVHSRVGGVDETNQKTDSYEKLSSDISEKRNYSSNMADEDVEDVLEFDIEQV